MPMFCTVSMDNQFSGGYAVWTRHIVNTEENVQYKTTETAQEVVGGCN